LESLREIFIKHAAFVAFGRVFRNMRLDFGIFP